MLGTQKKKLSLDDRMELYPKAYRYLQIEAAFLGILRGVNNVFKWF